MKVAIVHDDLVQWGGAERMLLAISEVFPEAPIYTSLIDRSSKLISENFKNKKIITSFLQEIPGWKYLYKVLLPLYPVAFEQFDFSKYDLVISQTTRFAKAIITKTETKHICYCHTPPRFLWNFSGEKIPGFLNPLISRLRTFDDVSSARVDEFLAGSKNCQGRIKKIYKRDSKVLLPFVDFDRFKNVKKFDGGYFLIIARLNEYKRVDLAVNAFKKRKEKLIVVGRGSELGKLRANASSNIEFLGKVSENLLLYLLGGCRGLIITSEEDFGLTSLEAQACGKGVIAYGEGGARETVLDGQTGVLFPKQNKESLNEALEKFYSIKISPEKCREWARQFSKDRFVKELQNSVRSYIISD